MSIYSEKRSSIYWEVSNSNADLNSVNDWEKLINSLPEDEAEICEQIYQWLEEENRPKIKAAYEEISRRNVFIILHRNRRNTRPRWKSTD